VTATLERLEATLADLRRLEVGERELAVRTDILDLVAVCDHAEAARELAGQVAELPYNRPSRAIVALIDEERRPLEFDARVFCTPDREHEHRVAACSELVTFTAGSGGAALPSLIAGLLLPDLPGFLLWRSGSYAARDLLESLWPLVTRVIVDSTNDPGSLALLPLLLARAPARDVTDLSWTKITGWRDTVARLFDVPESRPALDCLDHVEIRHAGASDAQSRLLAGWLASRTGRRPRLAIIAEQRADMKSGSLTRVELRCKDEVYLAERIDEGIARMSAPRIPEQNVRIRVPHAPELLAQELDIFGRDVVFEEALTALP
jgi:glucose-6-phosphate dehydrogenase assembly protein OpcA